MPLETESNVNDDAQEQQESHIDLINETARMKHLAMNQELRNQVNQQGIYENMGMMQQQFMHYNPNNNHQVYYEKGQKGNKGY